jgi:polyisoprenoid-binding protein YceI
MKTMKQIITLLAITFSLFTANAQNIIDSKVKFEIGNMGFKTVEGSFSNIQGDIQFNSNNVNESSFNVCIPVNTVNTENEKRDEHLLADDFFHQEKYPNICFVSTKISKTKEGFVAEGTLSIKGIEQTVSIPFTYSDKTYNGSLELERLDYGLGPNGGFMIAKTVTLSIYCQVD